MKIEELNANQKKIIHKILSNDKKLIIDYKVIATFSNEYCRQLSKDKNLIENLLKQNVIKIPEKQVKKLLSGEKTVKKTYSKKTNDGLTRHQRTKQTRKLNDEVLYQFYINKEIKNNFKKICDKEKITIKEGLTRLMKNALIE